MWVPPKQVDLWEHFNAYYTESNIQTGHISDKGVRNNGRGWRQLPEGARCLPGDSVESLRRKTERRGGGTWVLKDRSVHWKAAALVFGIVGLHGAGGKPLVGELQGWWRWRAGMR